MKKIFIYSLIAFLLMPISGVVNAATAALPKEAPYTLLEPLPCMPGSTNCVTATGTTDRVIENMPLNDYIGYIFKFAIAIATFLAIVMIIWGGFQYLTIESFTGKISAKKTIQDAATGLLMVFASYLILRTIDPRLVDINTNITPIEIKSGDAINFRTQLGIELSTLTAGAMSTNAELQSQIDAQQKLITTFENTHEGYNGGYNGDQATPEEITAYEAAKQQMAELKRQQAFVVADGTVANQIGVLTDVASLGHTDAGVTANAVSIIDRNYQAVIDNLDKQRDAGTIAELKNRQAFFNDTRNFNRQIETQGVMVPTYTSGGSYGVSTRNDNSVYLNAKLTEYNASLAAATANAQVTDASYIAVLKSRIAQINTALKK